MTPIEASSVTPDFFQFFFHPSQITDLEQQNRKLETQALSVQHRLANLQVL